MICRSWKPYGIGLVTALVLDVCFNLRWWERLVVYTLVGVAAVLACGLVTMLVKRRGQDGSG